MKNITRAAFLGLTLLATLATTAAFADVITFKAAMSGADEVPPTTSKGVGTLDVTFDSATKKLSWKGTYSGLTGPATAAHFHGPAAAGKSAGVEVPASAAASPFEGSATLTDTQATDLQAGMLYFNVHTAANPNGEIRGQVIKAK